MRAVRQHPIRYGVVGLGHIAQVAVLPGFTHARKNSRLAALVSGDRKKLDALSRRYRGVATFTYEQYEECLAQVDAVRLDHFRGFEAYWEIPAANPTAEFGRWVEAPDRLTLASGASSMVRPPSTLP